MKFNTLVGSYCELVFFFLGFHCQYPCLLYILSSCLCSVYSGTMSIQNYILKQKVQFYFKTIFPTVFPLVKK